MPKGVKGFQKGHQINVGKNNPMWKESVIIICKYCGKEFEVVECRKDRAKYCSFSCNARDNLLGEKHWNWQGGKSFDEYSVDWTETLKRSIRERDRYICQLCSKQQGDRAFNVHHIDYDKKNCNPYNLITLCHRCHSKTNYDREYWIDFFGKLKLKQQKIWQ